MSNATSPSIGRKRLVAVVVGTAVSGLLLALVAFVVTQWQGWGQGHWPAVARGREFLRQGRPDLALQAVMHIRDEATGAGEAMTVAGKALIEFKRLKGARQALERGLRLQPNQPDAARALADLHLRLGNGVQGVELLEEAVRLEPGDVRLWLAMGRAYHDLGEPERAARAYVKALELVPGDGDTRIALISELLNSNQAELATSRVAEAVQKQPDDARVLGLASRHARDLGHTEEALSLAGRALAVDPDNIDALLVRAKSQLADGHSDRSLTDLERAVQAHPNNLGALQLLAQVESRLGLAERAARTVERHRRTKDRAVLMDQITREIANRPDDPEPRYQLGREAAEGHQTLLASQCFQAALDLDPSYQPAKDALAALKSASPVVPAQGASPRPVGSPGSPPSSLH
jgi:tetratricopeptide (TPR) repeat protein